MSFLADVGKFLAGGIAKAGTSLYHGLEGRGGSGGGNPLLQGGLSAFGGAFPQTSSTSSTSSQSLTRTTPTDLTGLRSDLIAEITRRMQDPAAGVAPIRADARNKVNRNYAGHDQALRDRLLSAGVGESGKFGLATRADELARIGSLSDLEGEFAKLILQRGDDATSLAQRFLQSEQGVSRSGSSATKSSAGGGVGGAVGAGLETLTALTTLDRLLRGGGVNPKYASNDLGGYYGAGPKLP